MYRIKQIPEDFIVKENISTNLSSKGKFVYFILKKKNWTTQMAVEKIASTLNVSEKRFSYAGQKDKNAISEQYVAVEGVRRESLDRLRIKDISIKTLGYSDKPIRLGSTESNYFKITVRNLEKPLIQLKSICNYYDDQRFGGLRPVNNKVGKSILKKDFEEAIKNYLCFPFKEETAVHKKFRNKILENWGNFKAVEIPGYLPNEKKVMSYLRSHPHDFIGAIKTIPKRISTLFIQSFQSFIFNKILSDYVKNNFNDCYKIKTNAGNFYCTGNYFDKKFPLIGHDFKEKEPNELLEEDISKNDFKIKEIPYLFSRTTYRDACIKLSNYSISNLEEDELNNGKKKQIVSFSLPSGSYATFVIKCMAREN